MASSHGYGLREVVFKEIFPESWISCRKSASALRAVRKKRHPEMPFARSRPGIRPSGGFVAHLAFDHQMTPALFRPLFRASPSRGLHWRTGCRARLRRPSVLKHHAAPDCGEGKLSVGQRAPSTFGASGRARRQHVHPSAPRLCRPRLHLTLRPETSHKERAESALTPSAPVDGEHPPSLETHSLRPGEKPTLTGATALMVHKPNRHSHKDACHNSDKHIPEELLHGDILLPKDVPHGPHLRPFAPGRQADLCPKRKRC